MTAERSHPAHGPRGGDTSTIVGASPPPGGAFAVQIRGVAKRFGETVALRDVTLEARAGEIHAIVGENGSGKSTLVKLLAGVLEPDAGTLAVDGTSFTTPAAACRAGVAAVFQEVLIAEGTSVTDNVLVGPDQVYRRSSSRTERRRTVGDLLTRLTGEPLDPDTPVESLSLSSRQWVTIARALHRHPKVLILDESTAALDLSSAQRLHEELLTLKAQGCCILIVTHRIAELVGFADRATVLRDGVAVGVLDREELSEERLLTLMSGTQPRTAGPARPEVADAAPLLVAFGLKTAPEAEPVNLTLRAGTITGFAGLEGHGQAALLRMLSGIHSAAAGTVTFHPPAPKHHVDAGGAMAPAPVEVRSLRAATTLGIVYVSGDRRREGILPNLSVMQNFAMPLYARWRRWGFIRPRLIRAPFKEQAADLSIRLGSPDQGITTLSGGNQQKILIGRALAMKPVVLALNDPARGVDIGTKREIYERLRLLADQGSAVIYLSSEIDEFVGLCDQVAVMHRGGLFALLAGSDINVGSILAAMFGHRLAEHEVENLMGEPA